MVKNPPSNAGDTGLIPGQRTNIPLATHRELTCCVAKSLHAAAKDPACRN